MEGYLFKFDILGTLIKSKRSVVRRGLGDCEVKWSEWSGKEGNKKAPPFPMGLFVKF